MRKFEYKYKVDEEHKTVVAMSTFAGKAVSGVARCAPEDTFDIETGKKLAAARCAVKIAKKRMMRAKRCKAIATNELNYWTDRVCKMSSYDADSAEGYNKALADLAELEKSFVHK